VATRTADQNQTTEKMTSLQFALAAAELVHNTRCEDVVVLDLRGRSPVTEFFVIATGTSPRQMRTAVEEVQDLGKKVGFAAWQTSGLETGRWILLDCVNVVCHVFDNESRDFYDLELLWGDCPRLDWRKELGLPPEDPRRPRREDRSMQSAGLEDIEAEEEDRRLSGETEEEEGDADIDEDADTDAPVVVELPDESTPMRTKSRKAAPRAPRTCGPAPRKAWMKMKRSATPKPPPTKTPKPGAPRISPTKKSAPAPWGA
jgi:ribosome-associated protein